MGSLFFGYRPVSIQGTSMKPALLDGDQLWVKYLEPAEVKVGDIVAEGLIHMDHYQFKVDNLASLPLLMSVNSDINIDHDDGEGFDDPGTSAVLYAPNGQINLNHVLVYGSVAAEDVIVNQAEIFYPASLKGRPDLPGAGLETISYGYK